VQVVPGQRNRKDASDPGDIADAKRPRVRYDAVSGNRKPEAQAAKPAPRTASPAETAPKPTTDAASKKKERTAKPRSSDDD